MVGTTLITALVASLCLFSGAGGAPLEKKQTLSLEDIQKQALANAWKVLNGTLDDGMTRGKTCNAQTVSIRKEYGDLSKDERKEYIRAVKCLLSKPSKLSATKYPGAKTRYDDFVVVHMNMTPSVHSTANFMHWHRYYIYAYETALKTECEFKGSQPYWNWAKYTDLPASPIFDGSETSMGGNGEAVSHKSGMPGTPAGPGGGCVKTGPFAGMNITLGPLMPTMDAALKIPKNPRADGYGYNPRCLRRDVNNYFITNWMKPANLVAQITGNSAIGKFQDSLQNGFGGAQALHSSGHFSIWGDPGGDVHWWQWANYLEAQVKTRASMYEGGTNWMNPNSARGKATDPQWLDVVTPAGTEGIQSNQLFSTTAGPFCYLYQ